MLLYLPWTIILKLCIEVLHHGSFKVYFQIICIVLCNHKHKGQEDDPQSPVTPQGHGEKTDFKGRYLCGSSHMCECAAKHSNNKRFEN